MSDSSRNSPAGVPRTAKASHRRRQGRSSTRSRRSAAREQAVDEAANVEAAPPTREADAGETMEEASNGTGRGTRRGSKRGRRSSGDGKMPAPKGDTGDATEKTNAADVPVATGILHTPSERGDGQLRDPDNLLRKLPDAPVIPRSAIDANNLRPGNLLQVTVKKNGKLDGVQLVENLPTGEWKKTTPIYESVALDPEPQIRTEHDPKEATTRIVDIIAPIGFGQRGLIVAPPRVGKTILLQNLAKGIAANNPDADLFLLLIDERPEEVTDMRRNVPGTVIASSNDNEGREHIDLAILASERFKRIAETGRDVIVLMDSLTRLGRAFNRGSNSGKTLSGGIDARALEVPKKIFGAARKIEGGGSLTIVATCLVQTNSRMDDVIFEEFKGTGNMELTLDRRTANDRIFPAINIPQSGTRKEEKLLAEHHMPAILNIRKLLSSMPPTPAIKTLIEAIAQHPTNESFLKAMTPQNPGEQYRRRASVTREL